MPSQCECPGGRRAARGQLAGECVGRFGPSPRERFPPGPADDERTLHFAGLDRSYLVHRPPVWSATGGEALPLMVVLHGALVNAYFTAYNTGMNATADREGFLAVYPNGTGRLGDRVLTWNVGFGFGYASRNDIDDVGFLRALLSRIVDEYGADARRVYMTGISNGGMLCYRFASEASDVVAAVAPVAAASAGRAGPEVPEVQFEKPVHPVSVMAFHGMKDVFVPFAGGAGSGPSNAYYPPVQESIDRWVGYDGCSSIPDTWTSENGNIRRLWYSGGQQGTEVVIYAIMDGGHSWPGGVPVAPGGAAAPGIRPGIISRRLQAHFAPPLSPPASDISANDVMWEFFSRHTRT